ncbi:polysaccharide biosynthesis C-terminal domain-containing protein [uncultured Fibrobacter sp.]|uniref:polysaccharide biosynthesis C-terminal domain-containing protein n=1 Tax=uncultured Fibrobacter sp. TaxID=261512 RepID=UPI0025FBE096|nr:polysaccharide biosynthesis C-terminal domain-containing protein [uncultured Fibrobacter sp.]
MKDYYISSFVWGVLSKILNAVFGVISVPLLLTCFGVENYGVLTLATSVNAYMHLLDLGMNTGSIKFFSQWIYAKENELLDSVARTNLSFYGIIGIINASVLVFISFFGRSLFNISDEQFLLLQRLLWITAFFSIFNWINSVFSQLLTAAQKIAFVHKMMCLVIASKIALVYITLFFSLSVTCYFFFFTLSLAILILPYAFVCKKDNLLLSMIPCFEWKKFSIVFSYSLSIFVLNFFQVSATASRAVILGMFASSAAVAVAHYNIVQLMPSFILSISGILSSLLLPKASVIAKKNDLESTKSYLEKGTKVSSILCVSLCIPIVLCSKGLLSFIVGPEYIHLHAWLAVTIVAFCINLPTSTYYSMVLAIGKTKKIVWATAIFCVLSIVLNAVMAPIVGMGSAILAYLIFVIGVCFYNFVFYYPNLFKLKISFLVKPLVLPFVLGCIPAAQLYYIFSFVDYSQLSRFECLGWSALISVLWFMVYAALLLMFKEVSLDDLKKRLKR